jgi:hypothetical protein
MRDQLFTDRIVLAEKTFATKLLARGVIQRMNNVAGRDPHAMVRFLLAPLLLYLLSLVFCREVPKCSPAVLPCLDEAHLVTFLAVGAFELMPHVQTASQATVFFFPPFFFLFPPFFPPPSSLIRLRYRPCDID